MNYFPFHIGDYAAHTAHLEPMEDLAYRRLLDLYYTRETALPDAEACARLIRMRANVQEVSDVLNEFFTKTEAGFTQKRCDAELAKFAAMAEGGKRGAAKRWAKESDSPPIAPPLPPQTPPNANQNQEPEPEPIEEQQPTVVVKRSASDPSVYQVPDCPYDRLLDVYHEALPMLPRVVVFNGPRRATMRSRWVEVCAAEKYDADDGVQWFRDFLWGVRKSKFLTGNSSPSPGRQPFKADLEWLLKPSNFAKVVEGRYHGETA